MFCARCGKPVPEGAAFCPSCGAPVGASRISPPPLDPPPASEASGATAAVWPSPAAGAPAPAAPAAVVVRYGGFWRRVLAFIVDGLIIGAVMLPFGVGLGLANLEAALNSDEMGSEKLMSMIAASMLVWFIRVIVSWAYGAGFESSRFQATPGKMLVGVRVTDLNGQRITFARATGRQFGKWLSGLILCIGYLLVAFNDRKQGLHDLIASTLVREGRVEDVGRI
jgi:uncharacterized RDD family membrane protein YckC